MACTVHTPFYGSLGPRFTCYMGPSSLDMITQEHENGLSFDCMTAYLNCWVPRMDFYLMEAEGLYYSYTHVWVPVPGSKGYLLHGPYFLGYDHSRTQKLVKTDCMTA